MRRASGRRLATQHPHGVLAMETGYGHELIQDTRLLAD
jgi:hypothetical protein